MNETLNYCLIDGSVLSDEIPTVIKQIPRPEKKLFNLKTFLIIFIVLAIPVTLFPPYSWGEERLLTNAEIFDGSGIRANEVLPIKDFAFVFDEDRKNFSSHRVMQNTPYRMSWKWRDILLQRRLILSEWLIIYCLALVTAFIIYSTRS
jgi:hypothetical protein